MIEKEHIVYKLVKMKYEAKKNKADRRVIENLDKRIEEESRKALVK